MNQTIKNNNSQQNLKLSQKQIKAIELIFQGKTDQETADEIGINRSTVNQWRNHHPGFIAELNLIQKDSLFAIRQRLRSAANKAVKALEDCLDDDNPQVKMKSVIHILKALNIYGKVPMSYGPTTASGVEKSWKTSERTLEVINRLKGYNE